MSKAVDRGNETNLRGSGTKLTDEGGDQRDDKTDGQHVETEHGEKFLEEGHGGARGVGWLTWCFTGLISRNSNGTASRFFFAIRSFRAAQA